MRRMKWRSSSAFMTSQAWQKGRAIRKRKIPTQAGAQTKIDTSPKVTLLFSRIKAAVDEHKLRQ